jgi:hypothetical protein
MEKSLERIVRIRNNTIISVVDRHRFNASGSGSNFPFWIFWCRSGSGSYPKFYTCWKIRQILTLIHGSASYINFFAMVMRAIIFSTGSLDNTVYWSFWKTISFFSHLIEKDTYPDPYQQALDADPDPAKWCRSYLIRIHNMDSNGW